MRHRGEIVGVVDFGSRDIRVLVARQNDDSSIQVLGHGTAQGRGCVSQGVIQDRTAARLAFKQALTAAEKEARVKVPSVLTLVDAMIVPSWMKLTVRSSTGSSSVLLRLISDTRPSSEPFGCS